MIKKQPATIWTRRFLLTLFLVGIGVATYTIWHFLSLQASTADEFTWNSAMNTPAVTALIVAGVALQLLAHWIRAYKHRLLIDTITPSSTSFAFQGLSIGFLFNTLLPFRIGEFVRAHVVGKGLHISRTVVFITILAERAVDGFLLLFLLGLFQIFPGFSFDLPVPFLKIGLFVGLASISIGLGIVLLIREPRWLLRSIYHITALFNTRIKESTRFIAWSALFGTRTIVQQAPLMRYLLLSILMWALYIASLAILFPIFFVGLSTFQSPLLALGSYLSVAVPSGPAFLGTYHQYSTLFIESILTAASVSHLPSILTSFVMIVPIALVGILVLLFSKHDRMILFFSESEPTDLQNKLFRFQDVSHELRDFLETYFRATTLGKILSDHELQGKIRLIKTLTGGSNATTVLIEKNGQQIVRKTALPEDGDKLLAQYEWLKVRTHLPFIPSVAEMEVEPHAVSIEITYQEGFQTFFEYIHSHDPEENATLLRQILGCMNEEVYNVLVPVRDDQRLQEYIDKKIVGKIHDTAAMSPIIQSLLRYDTLVINGVEYINAPQIIERITANHEIMTRLAQFNETQIHGDLTIENIIVNAEGQFLILDPNNENAISDPIVDYAKIYQSLHSGYEFLRTLTDCEVNGNSIRFSENISSKYHQLFADLQTQLSAILTPEQTRQLLFHEAVHYCRMLTYRAKINPITVAAFYSIATRLFNEFYDSETR